MRLPKLLILSFIAGAGLLGLQAYWMYHEWKSGEEILDRQINYAIEKAVDSELMTRRNKLADYLQGILLDTNFVRFTTKYNPEQKSWVIVMHDPAIPGMQNAWKDIRLEADSALSAKQEKEIVDNYLQQNVRTVLTGDPIIYYTQRFGQLWDSAAKKAAMDTIRLAALFRQQLAAYGIDPAFNLIYIDTTGGMHSAVARNSGFTTIPVAINYKSINNYTKNYFVIAHIHDPGLLVFGRLWVALLATIVLLGLTLYCLYAMYRVIFRQKQSDEIKNDFISNMTHELKTPIATVSAAIDGLQYFEGMADPARAERYLNTSRLELQRLNELVSKVLDLSVYEKEGLDLRKVNIPARSLLETVVNAFDMQPVTSFTCAIREEQPGIMIFGDQTHLSGVFYNLVENALKYGKEKVRLEITNATNKKDTSNGPR